MVQAGGSNASCDDTSLETPKTGIYWLRRGVPEDLRTLVGKREEKRSLGTRDPAEAKKRNLEALTELEQRWANLRTGPRVLLLCQHPLCEFIVDDPVRREPCRRGDIRVVGYEVSDSRCLEQRVASVHLDDQALEPRDRMLLVIDNAPLKCGKPSNAK